MARVHIRSLFRRFRAVLCAGALAMAGVPLHAGDITVFAAASLKTALDEIARDWETQTGHTARISFAGSSALARQIQQGAPADIIISANQAWMDVLEEDGRIVPATRVDLLGNTLVLVSADPNLPSTEISKDLDLPAMLKDGPLAMALVDAVPAGIYGKAALESLGLWETVAPHVAQTDNVRAALALVAVGEAPVGVVYATDDAAEPRVHVIGTFPPGTHPPIVYPAAAIAQSTNPLRLTFLRFLCSDTATATFRRLGFAVLRN